MKKLDKKTKQKIINILFDISGALLIALLIEIALLEKDLRDKIAFYI